MESSNFQKKLIWNILHLEFIARFEKWSVRISGKCLISQQLVSLKLKGNKLEQRGNTQSIYGADHMEKKLQR